jgi:hypothetical protein
VKQHKTLTTAICLLLGLSLAACHKEYIYWEEPVCHIDHAITLNYSICGENRSIVVGSDAEWDTFMAQMMAHVRDGYVLQMAEDDTPACDPMASESQPYVTDSEDDANRWAKTMVREGYNVTIIYDKKNSQYVCIATK